MAELLVVGEPLTRVDAVAKVTGSAIFGVDVRLPGMLHAKILRSPHPHARILHIDVSKALRLKGVKAVVTGRDLPATYGDPLKDQPIFAIEKVRFVGESVAGVAAVDEETAEEALSLIKVEYEELPAVFDPREAMKPDTPLVHEEMHTYRRAGSFYPVKGTNINNHFKLRKGDVDRGFAESDCVFEHTFTTQRVDHCYLEPNAAVAQMDASGKITLWTNTQTPYRSRSHITEALGIPTTKLRVVATWTGGGFGGKHTQVQPECVALAMKADNRPVRLVLSREEVFTATYSRHPTIFELKTGVTKDGRIVAREARIIWDTGAYTNSGISRNAGYSAAGPYRVPHVKIDSYSVYTNNEPAGNMRGLGVPQITWALESQMDIIAEELGIDPLELRLRNAVEEGDVSATGEVLHSVGLKDTLRKAAQAIDWEKPPAGSHRGKGIACIHKNSIGQTASAWVKINEDGFVTVSTGATDTGQGAFTILTQIVAEELGVAAENVLILAGDTETSPYDGGSAASRQTFMTGNAVRLAAADARRQLLEIAAEMLEANPADLEAKDGAIYVAGVPERKLSFRQVSAAAHSGSRKQGPILGRGSFVPEGITPLDPETGQGRRPTPFWMYASQAAEVELDTETGQARVLKITAAHDLGKAINPQTCEGQIEGALVMGTGYALFEEILQREGRVLNPSFMDYRVPTALDAPRMVPILVEERHKEGPLGAKGLGEPGLAPTAAAIANAVFNAVGVRIKDLPLTPEKVLQALRERG